MTRNRTFRKSSREKSISRISDAPRPWHHIARDALIVGASVALAIVIARSDAVMVLNEWLGAWRIVGVFVAGFFFTSIATTAPAAVMLGEYAFIMPPILVALIGAAGSIIADLILFRVMRDHIARDLKFLFAHHKGARFRALFARTRLTRYLLPLLGGLAIASPLPDEIGVPLLGLTRISTPRFLTIVYGLHFAGIYAIGLAARAL